MPGTPPNNDMQLPALRAAADAWPLDPRCRGMPIWSEETFRLKVVVQRGEVHPDTVRHSEI